MTQRTENTTRSTRDAEMRSVSEFIHRYLPNSVKAGATEDSPLGLASVVSSKEFRRVRREQSR
jgi:hypothetical protein